MIITQIVHDYLSTYLNPNMVGIDATCGNGNDTLFLAKYIRKVYAFDIQQQAIDATKQLLTTHLLEHKVELFQSSHSFINQYIQEPIDIVVFNLGYLPRGDKSVTTHFETTLIAIKSSLNMLKIGGLVSVIAYIGHPNGEVEHEKITEFVRSLNEREFTVMQTTHFNARKRSPIIYYIQKNKISDYFPI